MKKHIFTSIIVWGIFLPILCYGKLPYIIFSFILAILGLREMIHAYEKKKELPEFVQFISYLILTIFIFSISSVNTINFTVDFRLVAGIILLYLIPVIIYQNEKTYSITNAFQIIGTILLLGSGFSLFIIIRNMDLTWIIYILLISIITDIYAFITGKLIGKHPIIEKITPKKTWEGMIGGTVMAVIVSSVYFYTIISNEIPPLFTIGMTLFLAIIGHFGDFVFAAIKKKVGIKDFSNMIPGRDGILDRFDRIFFILLAFTFFINII